MGEQRGEDRFEVVRTLGTGGFGVVYEVIDRDRGERVAMKTLSRVEADALRRFKQEFRALADVAHENLVRFHELLFLGEQWSFTMELVDGVELLEWVWQDAVSGTAATEAGAPGSNGAGNHARVTRPPPKVDLRRLRDAAKQIARGIAALHAQRLVHRDLKPSNVLVARDGRVVIVDFGIAKQLGEHSTMTNGLIGTPAYMAPEQGSDADSGPPADWYAFGVMLFEALTGRLPYLGNAVQVLTDKQRFEAARIRELVPEVPEDLDALVADLLRRDPARRPSGADVLRRLGDTAAAAPKRTSTTPETASVIGREQELAHLDAMFARAGTGEASMVILRGMSGMGKTTLVRRFVELAAMRAPLVFLEGRCYARESLPYKGFDGVIDALVRECLRMPKVQAASLTPREAGALVRIFPVLSRIESLDAAPRRGLDGAAPQKVRTRAFGALRELLHRLADRTPVVLFIDDLQWADSDTITLLGEITSPPNAPAILTIVGHRAENADTNPAVKALVDRTVRPHIAAIEPTDVGPLSSVAAEELAQELLRDTPAEVTKQVAAEAGGSPFFIGEIVRWLQSDHGSVDAIRIDRVVEDRVRELEEDVRSVLELVAVAERPVTREVLMAAADLEADVATRAISTLRLERLIRLVGSDVGVEPFHTRIREAVIGMLDETQLRDRHARLARALIATGERDPDRLFDHFRGAGDVARATEAAEAAATAAQSVFAFDRVAELLRYVIEALPDDSPGRDRLRLALAEALSASGHCAEAADTYLATRPENESHAIDLRVRAAQNLLYGGHTDRGTEVVESVLQLFRYKLPRSTLAALVNLVYLRTRIRMRGLETKHRAAETIDARSLAKVDICFNAAEGLALADTLKAQVFGQRGVLLALRMGEPARVCRAYIQEAALHTVTAKRRRDIDRGLEVVARAEAMVANDPTLAEMKPLVIGARAWARHFGGEWVGACADFDEALEMQRATGTRNRFYYNTSIYFSNVELAFSGQLAELQRRFPVNLREAIEVGDRYLQTNLRCGTSNLYWLVRDEVDVIRANIGEAIDAWSRRGYHIQHFNGLVGEAQADIYEGRPHDALKRIDDKLAEIKRSGILTVTYSAACLWSTYARAAVAVAALERTEAAFAVAKQANRKLAALWLPWAIGTAQLLDGILAKVRGDDDTAVRTLRAAATALDKIDMRLHAEAARVRLGEILGGDEGRALVTGAREWLESEQVSEPQLLVATFAPRFA
jgi:hypothetical protein